MKLKSLLKNTGTGTSATRPMMEMFESIEGCLRSEEPVPVFPRNQMKLKGYLLASYLFFLCGNSSATVLYTYTGNPFTTAVAPLTTSDFLTFSFTVADPIGASVTNFQPALLSWSISDGDPADTITDANPNFTLALEPLVLSTDAAGNIIAWTEFVRNTSGVGVYTTRKISVQTIDIAFELQLPQHVNANSFNQNDAGTWTSQNVSATPEPASFAMLSIVAFFFAGARFYRRFAR